MCFKTHWSCNTNCAADYCMLLMYRLVMLFLYWGIDVESCPIQTHQTYRSAETTTVSNHYDISDVFCWRWLSMFPWSIIRLRRVILNKFLVAVGYNLCFTNSLGPTIYLTLYGLSGNIIINIAFSSHRKLTVWVGIQLYKSWGVAVMSHGGTSRHLRCHRDALQLERVNNYCNPKHQIY